MEARLRYGRPMTVGQRFAYLVATPRWRLAWLLGAVVWCVVLNVVFITGGGRAEWIGIASVVPIWAFTFDAVRRSAALRAPRSDS